MMCWGVIKLVVLVDLPADNGLEDDLDEFGDVSQAVLWLSVAPVVKLDP